MSKTKKIWKANNLNTPKYTTIKKGENLDVFNLNFPVIVKPNAEGSSLGVIKVHDDYQLKKAIHQTFDFGNLVLIEEFIEGRELTCSLPGRVIFTFNSLKSACLTKNDVVSSLTLTFEACISTLFENPTVTTVLLNFGIISLSAGSSPNTTAVP